MRADLAVRAADLLLRHPQNAVAGSVNTILSRIYPNEYGKNHCTSLSCAPRIWVLRVARTRPLTEKSLRQTRPSSPAWRTSARSSGSCPSATSSIAMVASGVRCGVAPSRCDATRADSPPRRAAPFPSATGMLAASTIMIIGSALCAGAYGYHGSVQGMFTALIVYRLLTGIGSESRLLMFLVYEYTRNIQIYSQRICTRADGNDSAVGAEYPSGSVAASENTENPGVPRRWQHGLFVLATNSMIDIGFVVRRLFFLWRPVGGSTNCSSIHRSEASSSFPLLGSSLRMLVTDLRLHLCSARSPRSPVHLQQQQPRCGLATHVRPRHRPRRTRPPVASPHAAGAGALPKECHSQERPLPTPLQALLALPARGLALLVPLRVSLFTLLFVQPTPPAPADSCLPRQRQRCIAADASTRPSFITYPFGLFSSKIVDIITGGSTKLSTVFIWGLVINAFYVPGTVIVRSGSICHVRNPLRVVTPRPERGR